MQILYWILAIVMLGVLIFVHELGHFVSARAVGIRVMEFAMGFGPKLFSKKGKSGTTYSLRALPLGGFCAYYGEDEDLGENDMIAYNKQPVWKRFISVLAGPLMNFLVAVLILVLLFAAVGLPGAAIPQIGTLMQDMPAADAGLLPGDTFVEVNGTQVTDVTQMSGLIDGLEGGTAEIVVDRKGELLRFEMTPRWNAEEERSLIGIYFANETVRLGFGESVKYAFLETGGMVKAMVDFLGNLIFRGEGVNDIAGPVGTLNLIQEQTQTGGLRSYLSLAAMISVNLGFFNLLPIPGLDGSRLIFLLLEAIRRRPMDPNKEGMVHLAGFVLLMGLMVVVLFKDIRQLLPF